ncbi:MAG: sterol desaturase/sphingolipid hydroxylase (fatty acid hydroxylase superfamily) [Candidatus Azotimanducaceae bacterium]|jgi:sterol desaturase/sphingolipid hydroxylase (fatty acid hydroxylase superfamily)
MNIDLDTGRLIAFLFGLSFWLLLEQFFTFRTKTTSRGRRVLLHLSIAALNTVFVRLLVYVPLLLWIVHVEQMGWGIARWLGLRGWQEFLISLIVLDGFDYLWHRANHRIPLLWRFHKAHHCDNDLDVFTALRFHPIELLISSGIKAVWIVIWGPSAIAWFLFEISVSICAQMHHSNIDLPESIEQKISKFIVTPRFHALHHLVEREYGDRNFSTIFSFWDPLFRTKARHLSRTEISDMPLGLPDGRDLMLSMPQLLLEPFKTRNLHLSKRPLD